MDVGDLCEVLRGQLAAAHGLLRLGRVSELDKRSAEGRLSCDRQRNSTFISYLLGIDNIKEKRAILFYFFIYL